MADYRPRHRFYVDGPLRLGDEVALSANASEQIRKVLRLRVGEDITLFDGRGNEAVGRITGLQRNRTAAWIASEPCRGRTGGTPEIYLAISLLKSDRFETVIQKATELGVTSIMPLETDRSVVSLPADRLNSRLERWRRIAVEALEQSGRSDWVEIGEPSTFEDACSSLNADRRLIAWEEASGETITSAVSGSESSVAILIGPEGGFTEREVETARSAGFVTVSLGELILRSETAAIAALAVIRALASPGLSRSAHARED